MSSSTFTTRDAFMIACVCGATVLNSFQTGVMTVSISTIQKDLQIPGPNLQWCVSAYSLTYGCFLLVAGKLADIVSRRSLFLVGTIWFAAVSIGVAFSPNQTVFIVLMALMGIGAAANTPAGVGIFASTLDGRARDIAFACLGAGQPIGFIVGLCLGGVLCQTYASWHSLFYIQGSLAFLFSVISFFSVPETQSPDIDASTLKRLGRIDWVGAALSTVGVAMLTFSLTDAQSAPKGWSTPYIPALLSISLVLLTGFVQWERIREKAGKSTLTPLSLFRQPNFGTILIMVFAAWWSFNVLTYYATLYYQLVLELPPISTSLRFLPMAIAGVGINVLAGYLVSRMRPHYLIALGLVGSLVASILFALVEVRASYWSMMFLIMITLVGPDAAYTVANIQLCASVDPQNQALAGGIFNAATRLGTALGLAITSAIATAVSAGTGDLATSPTTLLQGYHAAGWVCFGMAAIAMIVSLVGLRKLPILRREVPVAVEPVGIELHTLRRLESKAAEGDQGTSGVSTPREWPVNEPIQ